MPKIAVNISDALRAELAESCERTGRSLTAEVEARLRHSLDIPGSDRLLLLRFDEGLWGWLVAYERGFSLWGSLHDTVIAMVRRAIMEGSPEECGGEHWKKRLARLKPHLPEKMQRALGTLESTEKPSRCIDRTPDP